MYSTWLYCNRFSVFMCGTQRASFSIFSTLKLLSACVDVSSSSAGKGTVGEATAHEYHQWRHCHYVVHGKIFRFYRFLLLAQNSVKFFSTQTKCEIGVGSEQSAFCLIFSGSFVKLLQRLILNNYRPRIIVYYCALCFVAFLTSKKTFDKKKSSVKSFSGLEVGQKKLCSREGEKSNWSI